MSDRCQPTVIWRFVNNSFLTNFSELSEDCFSLRTNEKSVSFFHSSKEKREEQLQDVHEILTVGRGFKVKMPGTYLSLDIPEALEAVNEYDKIIAFQDNTYPHVDLFYVSDDFDDIHEAKSTLIHISKLEVIDDKDIVKKLN